MRRTLPLLLAVLALTACRKKAAAEPAPTPPEEVASDLQKFLNGMLVTSKVPPATDPIWMVDEDHLQLDRVLDILKPRFGIETADELRQAVSTPLPEMVRQNGWILGWIGDMPTALKYWTQVLEQDPDDLNAAITALEDLEVVGTVDEAVAVALKTSGKTARNRSKFTRDSPALLDGKRCFTFLRAGRYEDALKACDSAIEIDDSYGSRTLVEVLLAMGKNKEALTQAELVAKSPGRMRNANTMLTLGLAQQANGLDAEARATWTLAAERWPNDTLVQKALTTPRRPIQAWIEDYVAVNAPWSAQKLAFCGHHYQELGIADRAKECYRRSEEFQKGPAIAHQAVFLARKSPEKARAMLEEAMKTITHIDLVSAMAWTYLHEEKLAEATTWVDRAIQAEPFDTKSLSLKWQICGHQKDYVCVIEYRKRLGLPTHFNVEQYQDLERAWQEQAIANGRHLQAKAPDSETAAKPPAISAITIVPLGTRVPPELEGMVEKLSTALPGVKISLGEVEEVPPGAFKPEYRQVIWEHLLERLREEPGRLYVVEHDLNSYDEGFAFARYDLAKGRGVISLSRLRSLAGKPTPAGLTYDGEALEGVQGRLESELVAGFGKLVGLSYPCSESGCAMHEHRAVTEFVLGERPLCAKHATELRKRGAGEAGK